MSYGPTYATNGIQYTLNAANNTASASYYDDAYTKTPTIFESFTTGGVTYTVTTIGNNAFNYTGLRSVNIPASVTSIGNGAFDGCTSLASVTFEQGSGLLSIGNNAFRTTRLTSINIPASVTSIGNQAFASCSSLASVTFEQGSGLQSIGNQAFAYTGLLSINIPASVTSIGEYAFYSCSSLASVTFGAGSQLLSIGGNAFYSTILTSINIPANVTSIGNEAFYNCNLLESVTFEQGSGLLSIGNQAFQSCTALASITIPASVTSIGIGAFYNCNLLESVTFESESAIPTMSYPFGVDPTNPVVTIKQGTAYYLNTVTYGIDQLSLYFDTVVVTCFLEGTKILTKEGYKKIEELKKGELVKTLSSGYKKIDMIGYKNMWNPASDERIKNQLYVYKKNKMEEVFEDLVLTGCHSVLIDRFETSEKREKVRSLLGRIYITEKKARLPACLDERAEVYKSEGLHTIYHVALENEDYYNNYGIYANGLLVESCSQRYLKELSGMMLKE